ncbi:MAG: hypothetical protein PHP32_07260 [Candidatus Izemoplasmatales bacterium]|nr:hypothetical protein [Candidatus Izemoplasmatales bacterium]
MKKQILQILYFGALWGFLEATLGWALHWVPALISGTILFPIATLIMLRAYQDSESKTVVFMTGVVAAAIKSVNFLLPNLSFFKVLNPMIAILAEGLVVVAVIAWAKQKDWKQLAAFSLVTSIGWRALFLSVQAIEGVMTGMFSPTLLSTSSILSFTLWNGLIAAAMTFAFVMIQKTWVKRPISLWQLSPTTAAVAMVFSIAATVAVKFL